MNPKKSPSKTLHPNFAPINMSFVADATKFPLPAPCPRLVAQSFPPSLEGGRWLIGATLRPGSFLPPQAVAQWRTDGGYDSQPPSLRAGQPLWHNSSSVAPPGVKLNLTLSSLGPPPALSCISPALKSLFWEHSCNKAFT